MKDIERQQPVVGIQESRFYVLNDVRRAVVLKRPTPIVSHTGILYQRPSADTNLQSSEHPDTTNPLEESASPLETVIVRRKSGREISLPKGVIDQKVEEYTRWWESVSRQIAVRDTRINNRDQNWQFPQELRERLITPSEFEILYYVAFGITDAEIVASTGLSVNTVKHHTSHLSEKLNVKSRYGSMKIAIDTGIVDLSLLPHTSYEDYRAVYRLNEDQEKVFHFVGENPDDEYSSDNAAREYFNMSGQTAKNHMTKVLQVTGMDDKATILLYHYGLRAWEQRLQAGEVQLTPTEQRVLRHLRRGRSDAGIRQELGIDRETLKVCKRVLEVRFGSEILALQNTPHIVKVRIPRGEKEVSPAVDPLTDREKAMLASLVDGKSNRQIAQILSLSQQYVRNELLALMRKIGVHSREQASLWAHEHGIGGAVIVFDKNVFDELSDNARDFLMVHRDPNNILISASELGSRLGIA